MIAMYKTYICSLCLMFEVKVSLKLFLLLSSIRPALYNEYRRNARALLLSTLQNHVQMLYTFCPEGFENAT